MDFGPLSVWQRQHSNGTPTKSIVLLAWHWRRSRTWRWMLAKHEWYMPPGRQGFGFRFGGNGIHTLITFNSKLTGQWSFKTQPNQWYQNGEKA